VFCHKPLVLFAVTKSDLSDELINPNMDLYYLRLWMLKKCTNSV